MSRHSFDRYSSYGFNAHMTFPVLRSKRTISGVSTKGCAAVVTPVDLDGELGEAFVYDAFPLGRFLFQVPCNTEFLLHFVGDGELSLILPADATVVVGDRANSFTTVGPRPSINPELAAVQRSLLNLSAQMRASNADAKAAHDRNIMLEKKLASNAGATPVVADSEDSPESDVSPVADRPDRSAPPVKESLDDVSK